MAQICIRFIHRSLSLLHRGLILLHRTLGLRNILRPGSVQRSFINRFGGQILRFNALKIISRNRTVGVKRLHSLIGAGGVIIGRLGLRNILRPGAVLRLAQHRLGLRQTGLGLPQSRFSLPHLGLHNIRLNLQQHVALLNAVALRNVHRLNVAVQHRIQINFRHLNVALHHRRVVSFHLPAGVIPAEKRRRQNNGRRHQRYFDNQGFTVYLSFRIHKSYPFPISSKNKIFLSLVNFLTRLFKQPSIIKFYAKNEIFQATTGAVCRKTRQFSLFV